MHDFSLQFYLEKKFEVDVFLEIFSGFEEKLFLRIHASSCFCSNKHEVMQMTELVY